MAKKQKTNECFSNVSKFGVCHFSSKGDTYVSVVFVHAFHWLSPTIHQSFQSRSWRCHRFTCISFPHQPLPTFTRSIVPLPVWQAPVPCYRITCSPPAWHCDLDCLHLPPYLPSQITELILSAWFYSICVWVYVLTRCDSCYCTSS